MERVALVGLIGAGRGHHIDRNADLRGPLLQTLQGLLDLVEIAEIAAAQRETVVLTTLARCDIRSKTTIYRETITRLLYQK